LKKVALIGYSGHAFVIADTLLEQGFQLEGYYDLELKQSNPFNLKYLGSDDAIFNEESIHFFPSVGSNILRKKIFLQLIERKCSTLTIRHESAVISRHAQIGRGNFIAARVIVNALSQIGDGCILNTGCIIEHECIISNFVHVGPGTVLLGNVRIGEGSLIGANSVIKPGVLIGSNVTLGAGSVVINDIPNGETWVGNPARKIK